MRTASYLRGKHAYLVSMFEGACWLANDIRARFCYIPVAGNIGLIDMFNST
jgi:hypothetical protein